MADLFKKPTTLLGAIYAEPTNPSAQYTFSLLSTARSLPARTPLSDYSLLNALSGRPTLAGLPRYVPPLQSPTARRVANLIAQPVAPSSSLLGGSGSLSPKSSALSVRATPVPPIGAEPIKRKGFFSFHFDDLMRANNVRNAWKIAHPSKPFMRNFYDRSLWESKKRESDDALKALIRRGMQHASTVCVLVGTHTWQRRWVKYEIARSVIDRKGLLAVHINGINHHQRRTPNELGFNPLRLLAIYRSADGKFYLYENRYSQ